MGWDGGTRRLRAGSEDTCPPGHVDEQYGFAEFFDFVTAVLVASGQKDVTKSAGQGFAFRGGCGGYGNAVIRCAGVGVGADRESGAERGALQNLAELGRAFLRSLRRDGGTRRLRAGS
jgi:hypothetical protein